MTAEKIDMDYWMAQADAVEERIRQQDEQDAYDAFFTPLSDFPEFIPEDQNENVLITGRWLERGGSAWIVSTAGTGKSIFATQAALCWGAGEPFAGLAPQRPLRTLVIQSEDSPLRVSIDREDIIAELTEQMSDKDWRDIAKKKVIFLKATGHVGADFLTFLRDRLDQLKGMNMLPDVVIINPFLAFIGGPITDGAYVTPFLRGGDIGRQHTDGLQALLEHFNIAALIFHHTPKPPTEKEISAWLKSPFPEYQGAGSSDITNWGRSFITMMKVPDHPGKVMLTAGKNGAGLGWAQIDGGYRLYLGWSNGDSIDGGTRHAWRELTPDEVDEICPAKADDNTGDDVQLIADRLLRLPACYRDFNNADTIREMGMTQKRLRMAWAVIKANPGAYSLVSAVTKGPSPAVYFGAKNMVEQAVKMIELRRIQANEMGV